MTRTYTDIGTGKSIDINVAGNDYLGEITVGLWEKLGFAPRTEEDCQIVARIIRNQIKYQEYNEFPDYKDGFLYGRFKIPKLNVVEIKNMKRVAQFFEKAKGIRED